MNKYLFTTDFISIKWYSFLLLVSVFLGIFLLIRESRKYNYPKEFIFNMCFWAVIVGFLGARAYYVIFNWQIYASDPISVFRIWEGGLAIHGGLIAGFLTVYFYCQKYRVRFLKIIDMAVPSVILAQAIGRWGNFFNQEAFGAPCNGFLKLYIDYFHRPIGYQNFKFFHPTFLYESVLDFILFIFLFWFYKKNNKNFGLSLIHI